MKFILNIEYGDKIGGEICPLLLDLSLFAADWIIQGYGY